MKLGSIDFYQQRINILEYISFSVFAVGLGLMVAYIPVLLLVLVGLFIIIFLIFCKPELALILLVFSTPMTSEIPISHLHGFIPQEHTVSGLVFTVDDLIIFPSLLLLVLNTLLKKTDLSLISFRRKIYFLVLVYVIACIQGSLVLSGKSVIVMLLYFLKWIEYIAILFLVVAYIRIDRVEKLKKVIAFSLLTLSVVSLYGIFQFFYLLHTGLYIKFSYVPRVSSFFAPFDPNRWMIDPNALGIYLMLMISVALGLLLSSKLHRKYRTLVIVSSFLGFTCLIFTFSRSAVLAMAASLIFFTKIRPKRILRLAAICAIVVLSVWMVCIEAHLPIDSLFQRFNVIWRTLSGQSNPFGEESVLRRYIIMTHSPAFKVSEFSFLGHGFLSFRFFAPEYLSDIGIESSTRSLYSFFAGVLFDAGVIGLIGWCLLLYSIHRYLKGTIKRLKDKFLIGYARGLHAGFIGILVSSLFMEIFYTWRVMGVFWFLLGLLILAKKLDKRISGFNS